MLPKRAFKYLTLLIYIRWSGGAVNKSPETSLEKKIVPKTISSDFAKTVSHFILEKKRLILGKF